MDRALREMVWQRANHRCEYCLIPQSSTPGVHAPDHIIALKHRGPTTSENLALACFHCNCFKGPCISTIDPATGLHTLLFNPRLHNWPEHFRYDGALLVGLTPEGRGTASLLGINIKRRFDPRQVLMGDGLHGSH